MNGRTLLARFTWYVPGNHDGKYRTISISLVSEWEILWSETYGRGKDREWNPEKDQPLEVRSEPHHSVY